MYNSEYNYFFSVPPRITRSDLSEKVEMKNPCILLEEKSVILFFGHNAHYKKVKATASVAALTSTRVPAANSR